MYPDPYRDTGKMCLGKFAEVFTVPVLLVTTCNCCLCKLSPTRTLYGHLPIYDDSRLVEHARSHSVLNHLAQWQCFQWTTNNSSSRNSCFIIQYMTFMLCSHVFRYKNMANRNVNSVFKILVCQTLKFSNKLQVSKLGVSIRRPMTSWHDDIGHRITPTLWLSHDLVHVNQWQLVWTMTKL